MLPIRIETKSVSAPRGKLCSMTFDGRSLYKVYMHVRSQLVWTGRKIKISFFLVNCDSACLPPKLETILTVATTVYNGGRIEKERDLAAIVLPHYFISFSRATSISTQQGGKSRVVSPIVSESWKGNDL